MDYRGLIYFMGLNTASGGEFDRKVKALQSSHNKQHKIQRYVTKEEKLTKMMSHD